MQLNCKSEDGKIALNFFFSGATIRVCIVHKSNHERRLINIFETQVDHLKVTIPVFTLVPFGPDVYKWMKPLYLDLLKSSRNKKDLIDVTSQLPGFRCLFLS